MVAMQRRALVAAGILGAALCFSLGWFVSRATEAPKREPLATPSSKPASVDPIYASPDPILLIDPSKVVLLPDASLEIDLPRPPVLPGQTKVRPDK